MKSVTGVECLSCGAQRSFVFLLNGDVVQSLIYFAPLMPMVLSPITLFKFARPIRTWWWIFLGVLAVVSYILRIFVV